MAALTDATLLCALNAVDFVRYRRSQIVRARHKRPRFGLWPRLFAKLVCVLLADRSQETEV